VISREVDHRLDVPLTDQQRYISMLQQALTDAKLMDSLAQAYLLVERVRQRLPWVSTRLHWATM